MKHIGCILPFLVLATSSALAQSKPIPPGVRQADQAEARTENNIPPPNPNQARVDLAKLDREADELSKLAQSIPSDVARIRQGMLPKDVANKLKQIEKLSKQLRGQLNP